VTVPSIHHCMNASVRIDFIDSDSNKKRIPGNRTEPPVAVLQSANRIPDVSYSQLQPLAYTKHASIADRHEN